LKLGKIYLDSELYDPLDVLLTELKDNCKMPGDPNNYDSTKGNLLLEAFALEI
jgi:hypothetical protein